MNHPVLNMTLSVIVIGVSIAIAAELISVFTKHKAGKPYRLHYLMGLAVTHLVLAGVLWVYTKPLTVVAQAKAVPPQAELDEATHPFLNLIPVESTDEGAL